jgi:hypothetical protein
MLPNAAGREAMAAKQSKQSGANGGRGGNGGGAKGARLVWSRNMHLRVAAPDGDGWDLAEAGPHGDGLVAAIRCMRGEPPNALALNAYAYTVADNKRRTLDDLTKLDWQTRALGGTFASVSAVRVETPTRAGVEPGCEVQIDGTGGRDGGALRVKERWVPSGGRLLVLTAAGPPELFDAYGRVIDVWLLTSSLGAGR